MLERYLCIGKNAALIFAAVLAEALETLKLKFLQICAKHIYEGLIPVKRKLQVKEHVNRSKTLNITH